MPYMEIHTGIEPNTSGVSDRGTCLTVNTNIFENRKFILYSISFPFLRFPYKIALRLSTSLMLLNIGTNLSSVVLHNEHWGNILLTFY